MCYRVEKDLSSIYLDLRTPHMLMKTHYFLDGRILSLPISGDGEGTLNFSKSIHKNVGIRFKYFI